MEIKPPGAGGVPFRPADKPADADKLRPFSGAVSGAPAGEDSAPGLESLRGASKDDLQDPARAEALLQRCLADLLASAGSQFPQMLSAQDTQYLAGWLANDPTLRGKLRGYLEQVMK